MKIPKNVGETDKKIRYTLGIISIFLATQIADWPRWVLFFLGVGLLLSGLLQFCSFYMIFGISTCLTRKKNNKNH